MQKRFRRYCAREAHVFLLVGEEVNPGLHDNVERLRDECRGRNRDNKIPCPRNVRVLAGTGRIKITLSLTLGSWQEQG